MVGAKADPPVVRMVEWSKVGASAAEPCMPACLPALRGGVQQVAMQALLGSPGIGLLVKARLCMSQPVTACLIFPPWALFPLYGAVEQGEDGSWRRQPLHALHGS
jgi:hypothetical protein